MRCPRTILGLTSISILLLTAAAGAAPTPVLVDPEQKLSDLTTGLDLANGDLFGSGVAVIGDVDADGVDDLAVGAEGTDGSGLSASGAVWILRMNADGSIKAAVKVDASSAVMAGFLGVDDEFGTAVAAIGDVDGNGVPDVAAGAANDDDWDADGDGVDDGFGINRGAIYILYLNANGTVASVQKINDLDPVIQIPNNSDQFGDALTSLGDLDGAGSSQLALAVGAPGDRVAGFLRGAVWVLFMTYDGGMGKMVVNSTQKISDLVGTPASFTLTNSVAFGTSLSTLGDLNGDSRAELVVGSNLDDDNDPNLVTLSANRGAAYVMFMNSDGTVSAFQKISDTQGGFTGVLEDSDFFGDSVLGLDDLDGDGSPELAVGAGGDDDGGDARGATWLLFLDYNVGTGALGVKTHLKISDTEGDFEATLDDTDAFGTSLAVSDLNNDNNPELLVGAQGDDDGALSAGAVHIAHLALTLDTPKVDVLLVDDGGDGLVDPGDVLEYTITATNLGYLKAENVSFSDAIPSKTTYVGGSVTASRGAPSFNGTDVVVTGIGTMTPQTTNPGAQNSVQVTFQVTVEDPFPVSSPDQVVNQGFLSSPNLSADVGTDDPDTGPFYDETVTPVDADPALVATKTDALLIDILNNAEVNEGDRLRYTIEIVNSGDQNAGANTVFTDAVSDPNLTLVPGSVATSQGTVTQGNGVGDTGVAVDLGEVQGRELTTVTITFDVDIAAPLEPLVSGVANQGDVNADNAAGVVTDDPDTPAVNDSTRTDVIRPPTAVKLGAFRVQRIGSEARLEWRVEEAYDHAGFHVYREQAGSDRVKLTETLLRGQMEYEFIDENPPRSEVDYWLAEISRSGGTDWHGPVTLAEASPISSVLLLSPARPNPFTGSTRIAYSVPESRPVRLSVYDVSGRRVAVLVDRSQGPGEFTVTWDGRTEGGTRASLGLYLVRLQAGKETRIQKVILTR